MNLTKQRKLKELQATLSEMQRAVSALTAPQSLDHKPVIKTDPREIHAKLARSWKNLKIEIPKYSKLATRLEKALALKKEFTDYQSDFGSKMEVVLVPPAKLLSLPVTAEMRRGAIGPYEDVVFTELPKTTQSKNWRVFLIYNAGQGLYMGAPRSIIKERKYIIAGHNMLQLGYLEYVALTLQQAKPLDKQSWTILFNGNTELSQTVLGAGMVNGRFVYEQLETSSIFGDDRFRPAMEIK